jgi:cyclic-di-AMP phosphodiesterase PgpH
MYFIDSAAKKASNIFNKFIRKYILSSSFLTNPVYQRWAIAIILCLILAVILAPDIHLINPKYSAGMISSKDIKADRDFLVEDLESTEQKKIDAADNVKSVYDYDSNATKIIRGKLFKALNSETEQKYSNEFHQIFNRFILPFFENKYIVKNDFTKREKERGITLRNPETQTEEDLEEITRIFTIKEINAALGKIVNTNFPKEDQDLKRVIFSLCKKLTLPNLTFNREITEKKKAAAMEDVKTVFFQVQRNEMIVREGEKISPIAIAKLNAFYKATGDNRFSGIAVILGIFCITLFLSLVLYFWRTRNWLKRPHTSNVDLLIFGLIIILQLLFVKTGIFISGAVNRAFPFISIDSCFFAIPFAMGAMIIAILINRNVALIIGVLSSFLIGFLYDEKIIFPLYSFLGSVAASYRIVNYRQRSAFLKVGIFLGLMNIAAIFCLNLLSGNPLNDLFWRLLAGFTGGILTGIFVAGITPIFESMFGIMTDIKLLELANLNQPVFQKMIIEAPGTYHHSIIVASLVEAASEAIGANSILAKVSAYYHDIGKLKKPQYFIENQTKNENKHDKLSPKMSSLIIISHVKDGCELAHEAKLGRYLINIIRESHGTSIVSYFYDKAKKDKDESIRSLSESDFRYPGPKPQTKEAGLVMLGDVVEASSRTLSNPTPSRIRSLVRERIERIYTDGQLDNCELTLQNLNTIADTFTRILNGIFHQRIDYPEQMPKEHNGRKEKNENTNR